MNKDKHCLIIRLTILLFFSLFVLDGSEFLQRPVAFFPVQLKSEFLHQHGGFHIGKFCIKLVQFCFA